MQGARILLVEDDDVLRSVIERNLVARGHEVNVAVDVQSALDYMRSKAFDLVLLDINLPDQTGWAVLRHAQAEGCIREQNIEPLGTKLPVVVLSAVRVSPQRLAEFHPLAYLPKPFPIDALLRLAAEAAERRDDLEHSHPASSEITPSHEEDFHV